MERVTVEHNGELITMEVPDGTPDADIQKFLNKPSEKKEEASFAQKYVAPVAGTAANIVGDIAGAWPAVAGFAKDVAQGREIGPAYRRAERRKDEVASAIAAPFQPETQAGLENQQTLGQALSYIPHKLGETAKERVGNVYDVAEKVGLNLPYRNELGAAAGAGAEMAGQYLQGRAAGAAAKPIAPLVGKGVEGVKTAAGAINELPGAIVDRAGRIKTGIENARYGEGSVYYNAPPEILQNLTKEQQRTIKRNDGKLMEEGKGWEAFGEDAYNNIKETLENPQKHLLRLGLQGLAAAKTGGLSLAISPFIEPTIKAGAGVALNRGLKSAPGSEGHIVKTPQGIVTSQEGFNKIVEPTQYGMPASISPAEMAGREARLKQSGLTGGDINTAPAQTKMPSKSVDEHLNDLLTNNPSIKEAQRIEIAIARRADEIHKNSEIPGADRNVAKKIAREEMNEHLAKVKAEQNAKLRVEREQREKVQAEEAAKVEAEYIKSPVAQLAEKINPGVHEGNRNTGLYKSKIDEAQKLIDENPDIPVEKIHENYLTKKEAEAQASVERVNKIKEDREKLNAVPEYVRLEQKLEGMDQYHGDQLKRNSVIQQLASLRNQILSGEYVATKKAIDEIKATPVAPSPAISDKPAKLKVPSPQEKLDELKGKLKPESTNNATSKPKTESSEKIHVDTIKYESKIPDNIGKAATEGRLADLSDREILSEYKRQYGPPAYLDNKGNVNMEYIRGQGHLRLLEKKIAEAYKKQNRTPEEVAADAAELKKTQERIRVESERRAANEKLINNELNETKKQLKAEYEKAAAREGKKFTKKREKELQKEFIDKLKEAEQTIRDKYK